MIVQQKPVLIGTIVQAFLYALYLVSLGHALRWLLYEEEEWKLRSSSNINRFPLIITVFVFVLSTADIAIAITLQFMFNDPNDDTIITQLLISSLVVETITMITIDAVLIYRCWIVYQKSWRVVCYPFMLWLANVGLMFLWLSSFVISRWKPIPYAFLSMLALQMLYLFNFVTNLFATSAIVYRVWRVAKANNRPSSTLHRVCRIVAETGILYTCTSLPLVVGAFLMKKNMTAYIVCDGINFSAAGVTFNLLHIRVGQLRAQVEMDVYEGTRDVNGTVLLSTVQFNTPSITTNE